MKTMKRLLMVLLVVLLLAVPVAAQGNGEVAQPVTLVPDSFINLELYETMVTLLTVIVGVLVAGSTILVWVTTGKIEKGLPSETLRELLPFFNLGGTLISRTETEIDDRAWLTLAERLGYAVVRDEETGHYTVVPPDDVEAQGARKLSTRRVKPPGAVE